MSYLKRKSWEFRKTSLLSLMGKRITKLPGLTSFLSSIIVPARKIKIHEKKFRDNMEENEEICKRRE